MSTYYLLSFSKTVVVSSSVSGRIARAAGLKMPTWQFALRLFRASTLLSSPLRAGMACIVDYDFNATNERELSIRKGEVVCL